MADPTFDSSFTRDGRPLKVLLLDAIDPNVSVRGRALGWLNSLAWGVDVVADRAHVDTEMESELKRLSDLLPRAIDDVLNESSFPRERFVRELIRLMIDANQRFSKRVQKGFTRHDRLLERISIAQKNTTSSPERQRSLKQRQLRVKKNEWTNDNQSGQLTLEVARYSILFELIGSALPAAPDAVAMLLLDQQHRSQTLWLIEKSGAEVARVFQRDLLPDDAEQIPEDVVGVVGTLARVEPDLVARSLDEIERVFLVAEQMMQPKPETSEFHRSFYGRESAWTQTGVLSRVGSAACRLPGIGPRVLPLLMKLSRSPHFGQRAAACGALAIFAREETADTKHEIVTRLLELTNDYSWVAGRAMEALGTLAAEPQRVLPRLVEMYDTFEEFDPDEGYNGEHARAFRAFTGFGPLAFEPIRDRIECHLEAIIADAAMQLENEPDLYGLIESFGSAGSSLLPLLERVRALYDEYAPSALDAAIASVRGEPTKKPG